MQESQFQDPKAPKRKKRKIYLYLALAIILAVIIGSFFIETGKHASIPNVNHPPLVHSKSASPIPAKTD